MRLKRLSCVLACSLLFGWNVQVWAEDAESADDPHYKEPASEYVAPEYQNTAQAAHDANVAEAYFERVDAEIAALEQQQRNELEGSDKYNSLEDDIQERLADRSVIMNEGDIARMRADGMGWGEIAHELGVHPGVLGLGHMKDKGWKSGVASADAVDEIAISTSINLTTGNTIGHGNATAGKNGKSETSSGKSKSDRDEGSKGGNGKGGGGNGNGGGGNGNGGGGNGNGGGGGKGK